MEKTILSLEALPETSQIKEFERELSETQKKVKEVPKEVQDFKRRTRHRKPIETELDARITSLKFGYEEDEFRKLVKLASGYDAKIKVLTEKIRKSKKERDIRFLVLNVANNGFLVARGMIYKDPTQGRQGMEWGAKVAVNPKTLDLEVHPFRDDYTKIIDGHETIAHRVKLLREQRDEPSALGSYRTNFVNPILGLEGLVQSDWKEPKNKEAWEIKQDYKKKAREFDMRLHFDQDLFWEFGDWLKRNVSPSGLMLPSFRRFRVEKGEAGEIGS